MKKIWNVKSTVAAQNVSKIWGIDIQKWLIQAQ